MQCLKAMEKNRQRQGSETQRDDSQSPEDENALYDQYPGYALTWSHCHLPSITMGNFKYGGEEAPRISHIDR